MLESLPINDATGCLFFYGKDLKSISHVAVGFDSDFTIIEAGGGGSLTLSESDASKQNAFIRLRPFNRRSDLVSILKPLKLNLL
jgi:hypothetical protein